MKSRMKRNGTLSQLPQVDGHSDDENPSIRNTSETLPADNNPIQDNYTLANLYRNKSILKQDPGQNADIVMQIDEEQNDGQSTMLGKNQDSLQHNSGNFNFLAKDINYQ